MHGKTIQSFFFPLFFFSCGGGYLKYIFLLLLSLYFLLLRSVNYRFLCLVQMHLASQVGIPYNTNFKGIIYKEKGWNYKENSITSCQDNEIGTGDYLSTLLVDQSSKDINGLQCLSPYAYVGSLFPFTWRTIQQQRPIASLHISQSTTHAWKIGYYTDHNTFKFLLGIA